MNFRNFRLSAACLGAMILASPTSGAVHHHGSAGMSAHRASPSAHAFHESAGHVFHQTAGSRGQRHLARAGEVRAGHGYAHAYGYAHRPGRRYGYGGYGGPAVVGTDGGDGYAYSDYGDGGYGYGYGYLHRSCRWYYYHEPYNVPYRCRPHGYAYSYEYGGPSYAGSYGAYGRWHGHSHRFAWSGGGHGGRHPTSFVRANHIRVGHSTHLAGGHHFAGPHAGGGARVARVGGHPKLH
jgi:hypothetical protein